MIELQSMLLFCFRRRVEYGLLDDTIMTVSDDELQSTVSEICSECPTVGVSLVLGRLRTMGYRVTRDRVRRALRAADPLSSALCWSGGLVRRQPYCVPGPNSLWHIG